VKSQEELEKLVEGLNVRLQRVEDIAEIQRLKAEYGRLTDARYDRNGVVERTEVERLAAEITDLFSDDAVWDGGKGLGVSTGRDQIYQRFCEPTLRFSLHYFVKPEIVVDGDRASGRWDILAPCTTRDYRPVWMAGYEDDEYVRVEGRWLHSAMRLTVAFMAPHDRGWAKPPRAD
jgi:hypothetical protein